MKIAILSRNSNLYSTRRLVEAAEAAGHEAHVIDHLRCNIEIEQKQALLRSKVEELKRMFEDKSLDELKGLKFSSEMDVTLKVKKPETLQIVKEEEISKNGVTEKV
jgi:glutathione synthase/RimK-type ligase-like ATP-grasp enzyme